MGRKGVGEVKDFPVFPTDFGVSSLILKEVPYRKEAYIHIQDVDPEHTREHLSECVSFCRMVGAERVLVREHPCLKGYPLYTAVYEMRGTARVDPERMYSVFPVTEQTVARWRQIHNERMRCVDNAGTLEAREEGRILESGGAYFIHNDGTLLGIGWLEDTKLLAVAGVVPGAGMAVMHTLMSLVEGADMTLEVASTNEKAIRLYEKLGFLKTGEICRWYRVWPEGES